MPTLREEYLAMDGANQILLDRCEQILDDIREGYKGASHSVNRCNAAYDDCSKVIQELQAQAELLGLQLRETNAALGQLQEQLVAVETRQTKMADWLKDRFVKKESSKEPEEKQ